MFSISPAHPSASTQSLTKLQSDGGWSRARDMAEVFGVVSGGVGIVAFGSQVKRSIDALRATAKFNTGKAGMSWRRCAGAWKFCSRY
jgi:hypothetical protein